MGELTVGDTVTYTDGAGWIRQLQVVDILEDDTPIYQPIDRG